jgi:hypothetical protein
MENFTTDTSSSDKHIQVKISRNKEDSYHDKRDK